MLNIAQSGPFRWSAITSIITIITYAIIWRFNAVLWFITMFIGLAIGIIYLIVLLSSLIFLFSGRKRFKHSFVPLCINLIPILIVLCSPSINRNKNYYKRSVYLNQYQKNKCACNLYIETYCVHGGGAWGSDVNSLYLTDSTNFKLYIGTYDEEGEMIKTKCRGDSICVEKSISTSSMPEWNFRKIVDKKSYSLKDLKVSMIAD